MHVGMGVIFQGQGEGRTDRNVYRNELRFGDLAEPLGFESLWGVEHHFTDYTMCPDVLQYLTYFAGRTKRIQLGSMVVVLPWHQPVRVAEQVLVLDHLSNGRLIFGIGRGLGRVEFEGFGVAQEDSRAIFVEAAQTVLQALEHGYCEYDGTYVQQPRRELRPRPFKSFRGRTYAAAVSPESSEIMARLGIGILIIPQKPWEAVTRRAQRLPPSLPRGERRRGAAADRRRMDVLRRERRPRRERTRVNTSVSTGARSCDTTSWWATISPRCAVTRPTRPFRK